MSDSATPWTAAHQVPLSTGFSRQEYWSRLPFPSPRDFPYSVTEPGSPALQADSLPLGHLGGPTISLYKHTNLFPTLQTRELRLREEPGQSASGFLPQVCLLQSHSRLQEARPSLGSKWSDGAQGQGSTRAPACQLPREAVRGRQGEREPGHLWPAPLGSR